MKNKKQLSKIFFVTCIFSSQMYSQNCPVTIPINSPNGTTLCLEGIWQGNPDPVHNVCLENDFGNLKLNLFGNPSSPLGRNINLFTFDKFGSFTMGDRYALDGKLSIKGANPVNNDFNNLLSKRDISFEFESAGSAKIRSFRGGNYDTYIQFLTNPYTPVNASNPDNPIVRMQIDSNGDIAIKGAYDLNTNIVNPTFKRDLSFEFQSAASSKMRSFRGQGWDTYLQFLTNPSTATSNSPIVRMHINENGNVGIGTFTTIPPKAKLEVLGNVIIGNISQAKMG